MARSYPDAYRTAYIDHAFGVRLIGPDGRQHVEISRALSALHDRHSRNDTVGRRWISAFCGALNVCETVSSNAAGDFVLSIDGCRTVQDRYVKGMRIRSKDGKARDGSIWVRPGAAVYNRVADALSSFCMVTELMRDRVFGGIDPSKVDPSRSRIDGAVHQASWHRGRFRNDTDRRLRLAGDPTSAPRLDDPRVFDRWLTGLERSGAPAPFSHVMSLARHGGGRAFQCLGPTLFDFFVSGRERHVPIPNKGGDPTQRPLRLLPPATIIQGIIDYVGEDRARVSGLSLRRIRQSASDPRRREELRSLPLFTEGDDAFIDYGRLYRVNRRAAETMDLFIDDDDYRGGGPKRYVGFHTLRHEYVYERLDEIAELDEGRRPAAIRGLIAYMGWSGEAMLRWYSAHHRLDGSGRAAAEHNRRVDRRLAGSTDVLDHDGWKCGMKRAAAAIAGL